MHELRQRSWLTSYKAKHVCDTAVRLLGNMNAHVPLEITGLDCTVRTLVTLERLLASVSEHVRI